jgi:1-deoxy-D-xylulose-5-phosphate reductoisomerase
MTRHLTILGSTGSIGVNALRVVEALGDQYRVVALSGHNNIDLLAEQVRRFRPRMVACTNPERFDRLRGVLEGVQVELLCGPEALVTLSRCTEVDTVVNAVVGAAGLPSVLAAAQSGKCLAIANKEPLVMAGHLLMEAARTHGAVILPIDSEHSAVFQALQSGRSEEVKRIILTGSGGPFRRTATEALARVTVDQALNHPTWDMGPKITIDSATLMNKALEIIEAHWLFHTPVDKIEVLIHPESIVHSLVEFVDGSILAQLGPPDMCLPIQYALTYPQRCQGITQHLRLEQLGSLTFEAPDMEKFRALRLAYQVARAQGTTPTVFNAANEAAVAAFLKGRIPFLRIIELIDHCLNKHTREAGACLEDLLAADTWARQEVQRCLGCTQSLTK